MQTEKFTTRQIEVTSDFTAWDNWPAASQKLHLAIGEWGDPSADPAHTFVMAHGITGNLQWWHVMARHLLAASPVPLRLIGLDLRGRGDSDKPASPYHVASSAADIIGLLNTLKIDEPVNFMGHSLGAHIGTYFASHYPARTHRLILIDGGAQLPADVAQSIAASMGRVGKVFANYADYIAPLQAAGIFPDWNEDVDRCYRYDCQPVEGGVSSKVSKRGLDQEYYNLASFYEQVESYYPAITAPTVVLRAPNPIAPPLHPFLLPETLQKMTATIAGDCQVVDVKDTNHYTVIMQPTPIAINAILNQSVEKSDT